jgi:phage shock protein PspC (stress-responsive transcriptional regulator)
MDKKLQKDTQHNVIGGVVSGLANCFDIDASLVRLLFAIAFFVFSSGFWISL